MTFQAVVEAGNLDELQNDLDQTLEGIGPSTVVGQGFDYGNSEMRAAILLDTGNGDKIQTKVFVDSDFEDLSDQIKTWLAGTPCRVFEMTLATGNDKWRVLLTYTGNEQVQNVLAIEKEDGKGDEAEGIKAELSGAAQVSAFAFTYNNSDYAAMTVYTPA